jgi:hypothetical protein
MAKRKSRLSPYQKIVRAAEEDRGLRLTEDEVRRLAMDEDIQEVADRHNEDMRRWAHVREQMRLEED